MINIADEIKAKIVIEADTSGATEAAAALEKLQGMAGNGGIGDALAKQFEAGNEGAKGLTEALGGAGEALKANEEATISATEALGEHQQAIENTGAAYEALPEPVRATVEALQEVPAPMAQIATNAESLQKQISPINENFAQLQDSLSQTVPMLPQFADSLHQVSESFDPKQFGLDTFAENMSVFQDALVNPTPFSMIRQYLNETGQTWDDFNSSIGGDNVAALTDMAQNANAAGTSINNLNTSTREAGKTFSESQGETQAFTDQFNALGGAAQDASKSINDGINAFGGIGSSQYGPLTLGDTLAKNWGLAGNEAEKALAQMGLAEEGGGLGGVFKGAFGELGGVLNSASQFVMPLMALQMVGTMVAQVGQSIYDSAAIAEGPAAHSMGTFTGTVDALGQSMQRSGQVFSEAFGQNMLPTLNALNNQMNQGGGSSLGGIAGSTVSFLSNLGLLAGGLTTIGMNPFSGQMIQAGGEGLINMGAQAFGFQQPFQGPGPQAQAQIDYQQQLAQMPTTVMKSTEQLRLQTAQMMQEGMSTEYLQAQDQATVAQQFLQRQQASYNATHHISWQQMALDYQNQQATQADQQAYQQYLASGGTPITPDNPTGGGGGFFSNILRSLGLAPSGPFVDSGGPRTSVAESQGWGNIGNVLSSLNGLFSGGGGLENFAKGIMNFGQGFSNLTGFGQMPTGSVGAIRQGGFLGDISGGGLEHTVVAKVNWVEQNTVKAVTAVANWTEQNVIKPIIAAAEWTEQNVIHPIVAAAEWAEQNVVHAVTAVANWAEQGVQHAVTAVANWTEQNVIHPIQAAAQWTEENVIHPVTAAAKWGEENLEHDVTAVAKWSAENLEHTFVATANWVMGGLTGMPTYAEGTPSGGHPGGPAIVGEAGMEVVEHNGVYSLVDQPTFVNLPSGASVYPMQDLSSSSLPRQYASGTGGDMTLIPLPMLNMGGGGGPQTANIHVYLDSQMLIQSLGASLMSSVNIGLGKRSY